MKKRTGKSMLAVLFLATALVCSACGGNVAKDAQNPENGDEQTVLSDGAGTGDTAGENAADADGQNAEDSNAGDGTEADGGAQAEGSADVSALREQMGFHVDGQTLLDANGNPFVMRGINHAHTWFADQLGTALKAIQETGSNAVRIVLSDGAQWTKTDAQTVSNILAICKNLGMVAIFEVHDATGYNDVDSLLQAAGYFVEIKDVLIGEEDYCIINIANEWGGDWNGARWCEGYSQAIPMLREAGLAHTIMVDACGWGQYGKCIGDYGREVFEADVLGNTMFSVHMYGTAGGTEQSIDENMGYALDQDLCLVIGEFGYNHSDGDVQEDYIMARCVERNVGYLAWSWKGNGGGVEYLDLSEDWSGNTLSVDWGEVVVNGENGIRETAEPCTVFAEGVNKNEGIVENQEEVEEVSDLDAFYQSPTLQEYKDIRNLEESYSKEQAQLDSCFVIGAMVHNDYLYDEFMAHVQNGEDAFIRVVQYNAEGDVIIDDILYVCDSNKVYLVHDRTRDRFADEDNRSITLNEFDNIAEYNYKDHLYWIVFNGEISDVNFESANTFVITLIN